MVCFFRRNGYLVGWNLSKGFYIQPFQHLKTINKKNGIFCNSSNVKKNGHQRNVQMYRQDSHTKHYLIVALRGQFGITPHHLFHLVGRSLHVSRTAMLGRPYRELQGAIRLVSCGVKLPYLCDIFYFRCHLPWKTNVFCFFFNVFHGRQELFLAFIVVFHGRKEVIVKKSFVFHGRRAFFLHFFISSMEENIFR